MKNNNFVGNLMRKSGEEVDFDYEERSAEFNQATFDKVTSVAKLSNELIYAKFAMNPISLKVFDSLMASFDETPLFQNEDLCDPKTGQLRKDITREQIVSAFSSTHSRSVKIKATNLLDVVGKGDKAKRSLTNVKAAADALFESVVELRQRWDDGGDFQGDIKMRILTASALGKFKGDDASYLISTFSPEFIPYLIGIKNYTSLSFEYHQSLSSQYSLRWYRLFKHLLDRLEIGKVRASQINADGRLEYFQKIEDTRELFNLHLPQSREKLINGVRTTVESVPYTRKKRVVRKKDESDVEFEHRKNSAENVLDLKNYSLNIFERPLSELTQQTDISADFRLITKKENEMRIRLHNEGQSPSLANQYNFKASKSNPVVGVLFTISKQDKKEGSVGNSNAPEFVKLSTELTQLKEALKAIPDALDETTKKQVMNSYIFRIDEVKAELRILESRKKT